MEKTSVAQKRKDEVLEIALDMFVSKGFVATTTKEIAAQTSVSEGLIFHYFKSKDKLFEELVKRAVFHVEEVFSAIQNTDTYIQIIGSIMLGVHTKLVNSSDFVKLFILLRQAMLSASTPENAKKLATNFDMIAAVEPIIKNGQVAGEFKSGDPLAMSCSFFGGLFGLAEQMFTNPKFVPECPVWLLDIFRR